MDLNKAKSTFQLRDTNVVKLRIENKLFSSDIKENKLTKDLKIDYNIAHKSKEENIWVGILEIFFNIKSNTPDGASVFDFSISINGLFTAPGDMPEQQFTDMLELNGLTALYSISRSTIASISSDTLNGERILLPMLNIKKIVEEKHQSENNA